MALFSELAQKWFPKYTQLMAERVGSVASQAAELEPAPAPLEIDRDEILQSLRDQAREQSALAYRRSAITTTQEAIGSTNDVNSKPQGTNPPPAIGLPPILEPEVPVVVNSNPITVIPPGSEVEATTQSDLEIARLSHQKAIEDLLASQTASEAAESIIPPQAEVGTPHSTTAGVGDLGGAGTPAGKANTEVDFSTLTADERLQLVWQYRQFLMGEEAEPVGLPEDWKVALLRAHNSGRSFETHITSSGELVIELGVEPAVAPTPSLDFPAPPPELEAPGVITLAEDESIVEWPNPPARVPGSLPVPVNFERIAPMGQWINIGWQWLRANAGGIVTGAALQQLSEYLQTQGLDQNQAGQVASQVAAMAGKRRRRRRRRMLTCSDKEDIIFLKNTLGGGELGKGAISALLSRCGR